MVKSQKIKIGIVQGRLVPPIGGKIQAFPASDWENEIPLVREAGFDGLEWIFDGALNPIWTVDGRARVRALIDAHHVEIPSVSADYLMFNPIFGKTKVKSVEILKKLIIACAELKVPRIGVPLEDQSELNNPTDVADAIDSLRQCLPLAAEHNIILATESSLPPMNFLSFMQRVNHPNFKINYDLGNSCACGYPTDFALRLLRDYISGIHIKDRTRLYGKTVTLGAGDTVFSTHFKTLKEIGYQGYYVIQGARGENDFATAVKYLNFVRDLM